MTEEEKTEGAKPLIIVVFITFAITIALIVIVWGLMTKPLTAKELKLPAYSSETVPCVVTEVDRRQWIAGLVTNRVITCEVENEEYDLTGTASCHIVGMFVGPEWDVDEGDTVYVDMLSKTYPDGTVDRWLDTDFKAEP